MTCKKYVSEFGKECWSGVLPTTLLSDLEFHELICGHDISAVLHTNLGSLTVVDRVTGFGNGIRDTETGFRDSNDLFWLASGMCDVRVSGANTVKEAIDWVKRKANTCIPEEKSKP